MNIESSNPKGRTMSKLLHLDSSGRGAMSVTQPLTAYFAKKWKEANPQGEVFYRNLSESDLQFVNPAIVGAFYTPEDKQSQEQKKVLKQSDDLLWELFEADMYVFGVPMYNFSVPAVFKAYIDLIARAGKTFSYENGQPKGLLVDKKLVVITASGGDYSSEPLKNYDFVEPYIRAVFGFIGVTDTTFIKAHGSNPETVAATSETAISLVDQFLHPVAAK